MGLDTQAVNMLLLFSHSHGEVSEWFMELVLKTSDTARYQEFESLPLRQYEFYIFIIILIYSPGEVPKW